MRYQKNLHHDQRKNASLLLYMRKPLLNFVEKMHHYMRKPLSRRIVYWAWFDQLWSQNAHVCFKNASIYAQTTIAQQRILGDSSISRML